MANTKQLKITKLFRKGATQLPEDCDELQEEIQQLEQRLKDKQDELFQLQRNSFRNRPSPPKKKSELFIRPEKIVLSNSADKLKRDLELMSMLSGMEVQSYVLDDHCCIVYHMQHDSVHQIKHGLRIDMRSGVNEVSKSSLPLGFKLKSVMEAFDNVMLPECLGAIRKALVAYYDRLDQFDALKKIGVGLFKVLGGSHIEVSFKARSDLEEEDDQIDVTLMLDYRVYDIRPKQISFVEIDLPGEALEALREQCTVFKRKPLHLAFRDAFINGVGPYMLIQQVGSQPSAERQVRRKHKRFRPNKHRYNDDTFQPEDCSESSQSEEEGA